MCAKGVAKAIEEIAEVQIELNKLQQTLAKKLAYFHTDEHPDGKGPLNNRLEDEIGDAMGALDFAASKLGLHEGRIIARRKLKRDLFHRWDADPDNNRFAVDRAEVA
jgi:hypothetical protein